MTYCCAICGGHVTMHKNNGLGTWRCVRGCKKPSTSINAAGAYNTFIDSNGTRKMTAPISTGYSHAVVKVKR